MAFPFEPNCLVRRQSYGIPLDIQSFCLFWLLRICTALSKKLSDHVPFCVPPVYTPPVPRLYFRTVELASLFFPGRFATAARHFENWKLSCPFLSLGGRMRKSRQARKKRKEKEREEGFFLRWMHSALFGPWWLRRPRRRRSGDSQQEEEEKIKSGGGRKENKGRREGKT